MSGKQRSKQRGRAAVGFRAHSGWAAYVVIEGGDHSGAALGPAVLDRGRIDLVDRDTRWFKQPYHAAAGMELQEAQQFLRRCARRARVHARRGLRIVISDSRAKGHDVTGCGVVLGSGRALPPLASVLRSHAMIHTAEGVLFRAALVAAARDCKLRFVGVSERELLSRGAAELSLPESQLRVLLSQMGKTLGPPWRQDEKHSALVAWLALAGQNAP